MPNIIEITDFHAPELDPSFTHSLSVLHFDMNCLYFSAKSNTSAFFLESYLFHAFALSIIYLISAHCLR